MVALSGYSGAHHSRATRRVVGRRAANVATGGARRTVISAASHHLGVATGASGGRAVEANSTEQ